MATDLRTIEESLTALMNLGDLAGETVRALQKQIDIEAERDQADAARRTAEAKVVDIGWRKNRLLDAIQARGFVVRWQADGTPEVLTKEEAEKRDEAKAAEMREAFAAVKPAPITFRWSNDLYPGLFSELKSEDEIGRMFRTYRTLPPVQPRYTYSIAVDLGTNPPSVKPVDAPQPEPTAEDYYRRAEKRAQVTGIGYCTLGFKNCEECAPRRRRLDAALREEISNSLPSGERWLLQDPDFPCDREGCGYRFCRIWQQRPWK